MLEECYRDASCNGAQYSVLSRKSVRFVLQLIEERQPSLLVNNTLVYKPDQKKSAHRLVSERSRVQDITHSVPRCP